MSATRAAAVRLPNLIFPDADWADAFEIDIAGRLAAIDAARLTLGWMPI